MSQFELFGRASEADRGNQNQIIPITGLCYLANFITENDQRKLLNEIDRSIWINDLKRRVQHYGYRYDYKKRKLDYSMFLGPLPSWATVVADKIFRLGLMKQYPDQVIVNEYLPGQGISDHVDCEPCFAEEIVSLSLGSTCTMELKDKGNRTVKYDLFLEPRSLVALTGDARYLWTHGIPGRVSDFVAGSYVKRERRISLTFRKTIFA